MPSAPAPVESGFGIGSSPASTPAATGRADPRAEHSAPRAHHAVVERRARTIWLRITLLALAVLVLLAALIATLRYRRAQETRATRLDAITAALTDGNFQSRVEQTTALEAPLPEPGPFAALGDRAVQLMGRGGLAASEARRAALRARVEAERVALFGERDRREAADAALAEAEQVAAGRLDTVAAAALLAVADGDVTRATAALDRLDEAQQSTADAAWLAAVVARQDDRLDDALEQARAAAQRDAGHPFAATLVGEVQAERGDSAGGLATLRLLLERRKGGHVDTRVAFERLRIAVGKRAGEAVGNLRALLEDADTPLSPAQQARIHDGIGDYHDAAGDDEAARQAYLRAMDAAPGVPAFMAGVARVDLRRHALDDAEELLERAARAAPGDPRWRVLLARVSLDRGVPREALTRIEAIERPGAEARFVAGMARLDLADEATDKAARKALLEAGGADLKAADELSGGLADALLLAELARYQLTNRKDALSALRRARTTRDARPLRDRALPFRAYGRALAHRGRHKAAVSQFMNAVEVDARDHRAHALACASAAARLDSKSALEQCRKALEINPHYAPAARRLAAVAEAWRDAGATVAALSPLAARGLLTPVDARRFARALVEQDDLDAAAALVDGASAIDDDASRRYIQGVVATARGTLGEARALLYAAADQLGDDAWVQLGYARLLLKQDEAAQAATYYRRAMTADDEPFAALGLAHAELDRGDPVAAEVAAREAERRAARSLSHPRVRAEALAVQARALVAKGGRRDLRRAEALLRKADAVEPDLRESLMTAGLLAEKRRRAGQAIGHYRRLTEVAPKEAEGWYRLGRVLLAERERAAGRAALEKALALDAEGVWGKRAKQALR